MSLEYDEVFSSLISVSEFEKKQRLHVVLQKIKKSTQNGFEIHKEKLNQLDRSPDMLFFLISELQKRGYSVHLYYNFLYCKKSLPSML